MLKKLVAIGALAACSFAQAEIQELKVVYQGFLDARTNTFNPDLRLEAFFDVEDRNGDGTYAYDELLNFSLPGFSYTGSCWNGEVTGSCLSSFSYTPGSDPQFAGGKWASDEYTPSHMTFVAGEYYESVQYWTSRPPTIIRWLWTDATRTTVLVAVQAVPEPSQYAMLAVGLAGMLAVARRRRG